MKKENRSLQERYIEFQILTEQISKIQQQTFSLSQQIMELKILKDSLNRLTKINLDTESFIPISPNIFVKAEIKDNKDVLVSVGSNVLVKKTILETEKIIDTQIKEIEEVMEKLQNDLKVIETKSIEIQEELIKSTKK